MAAYKGLEADVSYNGYEYNQSGVCINPDKIYEFGSHNECYFAISVSETPRGWVHGHDCAVKTDCRGSGCGCWHHARECYPSKSKAIVACAERIKEWFGEDKNAKDAIKELDRIIAEEAGKKAHLKQYSIFDYL